MYEKDAQVDAPADTQMDVSAEALASLRVLADDELAALSGGDGPWPHNP